MERITKELVSTLGSGTETLRLRVGLHSGPTTAGVLRGERARFQLFGDTVNTASRMESTGMKGRIQVSQATYDILLGSGKMSWLKPREEKIVAKGKGEMQTYWLMPKREGTIGSGFTSESSSVRSPALDDLHIPQAFPAGRADSPHPQRDGSLLTGRLLGCQ